MPAPCQHEQPGTFVRLDLIDKYAARGVCCVHGHMTDRNREYHDLVEARSYANARAEIRNMR